MDLVPRNPVGPVLMTINHFLRVASPIVALGCLLSAQRNLQFDRPVIAMVMMGCFAMNLVSTANAWSRK